MFPSIFKYTFQRNLPISWLSAVDHDFYRIAALGNDKKRPFNGVNIWYLWLESTRPLFQCHISDDNLFTDYVILYIEHRNTAPTLPPISQINHIRLLFLRFKQPKLSLVLPLSHDASHYSAFLSANAHFAEHSLLRSPILLLYETTWPKLILSVGSVIGGLKHIQTLLTQWYSITGIKDSYRLVKDMYGSVYEDKPLVRLRFDSTREHPRSTKFNARFV
jgi:hypothetical protein